MKKALLSTIAVIILIVILGVTITSYRTRQEADNKHNAEVAALEEARAVQLEKQAAAYTRERLECEKGVAAYLLLIAAQPKNTTPKPVCGPAVIK